MGVKEVEDDFITQSRALMAAKRNLNNDLTSVSAKLTAHMRKIKPMIDTFSHHNEMPADDAQYNVDYVGKLYTIIIMMDELVDGNVKQRI